MRGNHRRRPWVMYFPRGLREQPAWIFIGFMFVLVGFGYATGLTESSISQAVGRAGLQVWGIGLTLTGALLITATVSVKPALEKLALRVLSINLALYMGWLFLVIDLKRAASTLLLGGALILLAEFRVVHLKALIRSADQIRAKVGDIDG